MTEDKFFSISLNEWADIDVAEYIKKAKHSARALVNASVNCGKITREPCEVCGKRETVVAHHDNHLEPLNVRWLCKVHHHKIHGKGGPMRENHREFVRIRRQGWVIGYVTPENDLARTVEK